MEQEDVSSKRFDNLLVALEALESKLDYVLCDVNLNRDEENSLNMSKKRDSMQMELEVDKDGNGINANEEKDLNQAGISWEDVIDR